MLPVTVITLLAIACNKNNDNPNAVNSTDKDFIIQTYVAVKSEIQTAWLAMSKTSNQSIQSFGQKIVTGYQFLQTDLIAVANKLNFPLTDTVTITSRSISGLNLLSGYSFDTAYMHNSARSHMYLLTNFQNELNKGNNTYVRYYFLNKYTDQVKSLYLEADSISRGL
jgi:putative membrane protein